MVKMIGFSFLSKKVKRFSLGMGFFSNETTITIIAIDFEAGFKPDGLDDQIENFISQNNTTLIRR